MDMCYIAFMLVAIAAFADKPANAETWDKIKDEIGIAVIESSDLYTSIRPNQDSSQTMNVTIDFNMVSINDFDETNGYLEVSGFVVLSWIADALPDIPIDVTVSVANTQIWKPSVLLVNSLKDYDLIGFDSHVQVRLNTTTKQCTWNPWIIKRIACSPNVKYYPFDRNQCAFRFAVWGDTELDVSLTPNSLNWSYMYYEENGEWTILRTWIETTAVSSSSTVDFKIEVKRRPMYYVVNLIAPVLLLGLVTAFTFLLPVDSGERVGFSITCFLSYIVLLNMIMGFLPTSAAPLSYLSYYTFIMMMFSAGVAVTTIISVRIHFKSENDHIPGFISGVYKALTCKYCKTACMTGADNGTIVQSLTTVSPVSAVWDDEPDESLYVNNTQKNSRMYNDNSISQSSKDSEDDKVTWKQIAAFLDMLFFLGFLGGQIFFSVAYLVPIFIN